MTLTHTIEFLASFVIGYGIGFWLVSSIKKLINKDRRRSRDVNVEWYGPDVYLKNKVYDVIDVEITDNEKHKNAEKKRIENVKKRNGRSNTESIENTRD